MAESNSYSVDHGALGSGGTILGVTRCMRLASLACVTKHASPQGIRQWPMHSVAESMVLPHGQYAEERRPSHAGAGTRPRSKVFGAWTVPGNQRAHLTVRTNQSRTTG